MRFFAGPRPGAMAQAVALGVLLWVVCWEVARAFVPVVAGATRVALAPSMRTMLANATEAATALVGTTAVRSSITGAQNIGGMGVAVTTGRLASRDAVAAVLAGAAVAAATAPLLDSVLDSVDCDITPTGVRCATPVPQVLRPGFCRADALITGICGGVNQSSSGTQCFADAAQFRAFIVQRYTAAGRNPINVVASSVGNPVSGFRVQGSIRGDSGCQNVYPLDVSTTSQSSSTGCPAGFTASRLNPAQCRPASESDYPATGGAALAYERLRNRDGWLSVDVARQAGAHGREFTDAEAVPFSEGPATVPLPSRVTTRTEPDGTTVVETVAPVYEITYKPTEVSWRLKETKTTVRTTPGGQPQTTTEVSSSPGTDPVPLPPAVVSPDPAASAAPIEVTVETCGLPGKPPCKIDESGTPDGSAVQVPAVEDITSPILACVSNPAACLPALPSLNWSFAMPTACGVIPLPAFQSWGLGSIDICQFQATFHDLMSMVWVIGGLFGAIGLFWRKTLAVA